MWGLREEGGGRTWGRESRYEREGGAHQAVSSRVSALSGFPLFLVRITVQRMLR